jgi:hypothetical protein
MSSQVPTKTTGVQAAEATTKTATTDEVSTIAASTTGLVMATTSATSSSAPSSAYSSATATTNATVTTEAATKAGKEQQEAQVSCGTLLC